MGEESPSPRVVSFFPVVRRDPFLPLFSEEALLEEDRRVPHLEGPELVHVRHERPSVKASRYQVSEESISASSDFTGEGVRPPGALVDGRRMVKDGAGARPRRPGERGRYGSLSVD